MIQHASRRFLANIGFGVFGAALIAGAACSRPAHAALYGNNTYSSCSYNSCANASSLGGPTPPTIVPTNTGLEVAINLQDGQDIPRSGYTIQVTPLNGQGASFQKVEFYINDTLVNTSVPDNAGEVKWLWEPVKNPGTVIKIIIYSADGTSVTKVFSIHVVDTPTGGQAQQSAGSNPSGTPSGGPLADIGRTVVTITNAAQSFIRTLPATVVYAVPYILFALLGLGILLVFLQTRRELQETAALRRFIERQQQIISAQQSFAQLSAHYLRTPLAIMDGGLSLLGTEGSAAVPLDKLRAVLQQLKQGVEGLLQKATATMQMASQASTLPRIWSRPGFWLPLACVGLLSFSFTFLAYNAGVLSAGLVDILVEIVVFVLIGLLFYQILRGLYLRRQDRRAVQLLLGQQAHLSAAQDEIVGSSASELQGGAQTFGQLVSGLPETPGGHAIHDGFDAFTGVLRKLMVAAQLRGTITSSQAQPIQLSQLVEQVRSAVAGRLADKQIQLHITNDAHLLVKQPNLVTYVLKSLLDNAIAYSPANATVEVSAITSGQPAITVTDHGSGIPAEKLAMLFQPFERVEDATQFDREGMGFSLYLDRLIMTHLGGNISATSQPGTGTTVTITLA